MPERRNCFRCGFEFTSVDGQRICSTCRKPQARPDIRCRPLSFRENQVCKLLCDGCPNKEIAAQLHLTYETVKEYMNRIFKKLAANNRTHAAMIWLAQQREMPAIPVSASSPETPLGHPFESQ